MGARRNGTANLAVALGVKAWLKWSPAFIMGVGGLFTVGIDTQRSLTLRAPLDSVVPIEIDGFMGEDVRISDAELEVAGVTDYLMRNYLPTGQDTSTAGFSLYIGYYDRQVQGKTIHSPKNCLPGSGWEALTSRMATIHTDAGPVTVNRYLLQIGDRQALVLYWYQGRGRVQANEYLVKWDLLRDAALKQRSDEALVRIVVPITDGEERAFRTAALATAQVVPDLYSALPQ